MVKSSIVWEKSIRLYLEGYKQMNTYSTGLVNILTGTIVGVVVDMGFVDVYSDIGT